MDIIQPLNMPWVGKMIIKGLIFEPARHLWNLVRRPNYRTWCWLESRYGSMTRRKSFYADVNGRRLHIPDAASFLASYKEIFVDGIYECEFSNGAPKILDIGANIGLSVIFFKEKFPGARVTAYEPDPKIYGILEENILRQGFCDVELINRAVWTENCNVTFNSDGADGGAISDLEAGQIQVEAEGISNILAVDTYDFIKLDIEGAENNIYSGFEGHLSKTKYFFIEYHSSTDNEQKLFSILEMLFNAGFRVDIYSTRPCYRPFMRSKNSKSAFDVQLNIFARKVA
jgi:FkbM family methyltransferase